MKKLVFSLLLAFVLFNGFTDNQVWVKAKMPLNVYAGDRFTIEITINKLDLQHFAEYKQILPVGFTAIEKQSGSANFSFKNQEVKYTWVRLPRVQTVTLSFDVLVRENIKGQFSLPGQFTYIFKNQRGTANLVNDKITVYTKGEQIVNTNPNQNLNSSYQFPPKDIQKVQCLRLTPQFSTKYNAYMVTLLLSFGSVQGRTIIEETLPNGYAANIVDIKGAIFTFDNGKIEIKWDKTPAKRNIEVLYKVVPTSNASSKLAIDGRMLYMINGQLYTSPVQEASPDQISK